MSLEGISIDDAMVIGDSLRDYWAARDAGFRFLGVETGVDDRSTFSHAGAMSISSLAHIVI